MADTLLVTGGAGFIGSNFIRYVLARYKDCSIINLDKLTYAGNLNNLKDIETNSRYKFFNGDICNKNIVEKLMRNCNIVINFAAESHVDNSINNPYIFTKSNVLGTHVLLETARKLGIKRFLQISTDEVYGSIGNGSFKETNALNPSNPYSSSKAGAELLAMSYFITYNFPVIITRSSNNYGPYQHIEKFIPLFITNLSENKKVPLYGTGLNVRDWLHVFDNCEAIDFVMKKGMEGEIYNIGGGSEKRNIDIAKMIVKELCKDESMISYVKDRPGHDRRYSLDCTKINKLGWKPKVKFENGLRKTIEWFKENEWWWKKLK